MVIDFLYLILKAEVRSAGDSDSSQTIKPTKHFTY